MDRMLDKGIVIETNAYLALCDVDLVNLNSLMVLSSIRTAKQIGLDFPKGVKTDTLAWKDLVSKMPCPLCGMSSRAVDLKEEGCPWCGWNYRPVHGGDKDNSDK